MNDKLRLRILALRGNVGRSFGFRRLGTRVELFRRQYDQQIFRRCLCNLRGQHGGVVALLIENDKSRDESAGGGSKRSALSERDHPHLRQAGVPRPIVEHRGKLSPLQFSIKFVPKR